MAPVIGLAILMIQLHGWASVLGVFGAHATVQKDGSCQVGVPRSDLQVQNAAGMLIPIEMGLLSSLTFTGSPASCSVTGEICVIQQEIDPVIDDLRIGGLDVTGLGNRLAGEQPSVYFIRLAGNGKADKLAADLKGALAELGKDRMVSEGLNRTGQAPVVDWRAVSLALGLPLESAGRTGLMRARSGSSWVCFGGCPCGRTMMTGLVRVSDGALQATIDALRHAGDSLDSIVDDGKTSAQVVFEAEGDAVRLAQGVRPVFQNIAAPG